MTFIDQILLLILVVFIAVASYNDIKTRKIPNWIPLSLFCIWIISVVVKWILADMNILGIEVFDVFSICAKQVLTSAIICCVLAACILIVNKFCENRGQIKHSVFGMGDIKLLMVVCLYLGFSASFICIFFACICFLIFALIYRIVKSEKVLHFPFAPFIFCGTLLAVLTIYLW